ncbi:MAG: hypothetical protein QW594_00045 [Candidatus Woesearchaeota archaeon]
MKILVSCMIAMLLLPFSLAAITPSISPQKLTIATYQGTGTATLTLVTDNTTTHTFNTITYVGFANPRYTLPPTVFSLSLAQTWPPSSTITGTLTVNLAAANTVVYSGEYNGTLEIRYFVNNVGYVAPLPFSINYTASSPAATLTPVTLSGIQGSTQTSTTRVTNTGNIDLINLEATVSALSSSSGAVIPASAITITQPGTVQYNTNKDLQVSVAIPNNQPTGTYTGTISIRQGQTILITAPLTLTVTAAGAMLEIENVQIIAPPNDRTTNSFFSVKNTGSVPLVNLVASITQIQGYAISVDATPFSLAPGETKQIAVSAKIPKGTNGGVQEEAIFTVRNDQITKTAKLLLRSQTMLKLSDVEFETSDYDKSMSNGSTFSSVKPGDTLTISGTVKNLYTRADGIEIQDVEVIIKIRKIDDGDDLEETISLGDLDANDDDDFSVDFVIPDMVKHGNTYTVYITVSGEDEEGADHELRWEMDLRVSRESRLIKITQASFTEPSLSCDRETILRVTIMNQGRSDEKNAAINLFNYNLNLNQRYHDISLRADPKRSDNSYTLEVPFRVADTVRAGVYSIQVRAYYNTDKLSDSLFVPLEVKDCVPEPATPTTTTNRNSPSTTTQYTQTTFPMWATTTTLLLPTQQYYPYKEDVTFVSQGVDPVTLAVLVVAVLVGFGLVIVLGGIALKR